MVTIEQLKMDWDTIIHKYPTSVHNAVHFLQCCGLKPSSVDGNTIFFKTNSRHLFESFNTGWIHKSAERIVSTFYGQALCIVCTFEQTPEEIEAERKEKEELEKAEKEYKAEALREQIKELKHKSHLPVSAFGLNFNQFEAKTDVQKRALAAAKEYAWYPKTDAEIEEDHDHPWSITFHGTTGTGKTMLAYIIAKINILELQFDAIFWNVSDLLNELRHGFSDGSYYDLLEEVKHCALLILDDLGMQKSTDWASEQIDAIIDARYRAPFDTIVTTNLAFKDLQPRIRSRLAEGVTVSMNGEDYRLLIGLGKVKKSEVNQ